MNAPLAALVAKAEALTDLHPELFGVLLIAGAGLLLVRAIAGLPACLAESPRP